MTAPKVNTIKRGDSRFYVHPSTGEKAVGVTSVVGMLPKPFLRWWAAKSVAEFATANAGTLVQMILSDTTGTGNGAVDWLKNAPNRDTAGAAETGTAVHDLVERIAKGENVGRVHPDLQGYLAGFQAFLDRFQPEYLLMEETVWSETHGYAGTLDAAASIGGEVVLLDYKTTRSGVHAEVALQLAAYAAADFIIRPDGERLPLPTFDGAAVLHLRPDSWDLVPVAIGPEVFAIFQALLEVHRWDREVSKGVLGRSLVSTKTR